MPPAPSPYGERREASLFLSFLSWALFIIIIFVVVVSYFTCLGGSTCRVLRVWKALGGSICRILYAARRPADPVKSLPCFILRGFLPRASLTSAHSRLSALVASSYPESIISSRINYFIPNRLSYPACGVGEEGIGKRAGREMRRKGSGSFYNS